MKKRIALGTTLLLTLGTAVAGGMFYSHEPVAGETVQITLPSDNDSSTQEVTPEMIAMWKATASSTDYDSPKAPI